MPFRIIIPLLAIAFLFSSCETKTTNRPNSTGKGSEILVVCDKILWDGAVGHVIREALTSEMEGLPESEPEYNLINVPYSSFSKFLQSHRNVLIVEIKPEYANGAVEARQNTWSRPQRVIKVVAGSDSSFIRVFHKYKPGIKDMFDRNERARFSAQNALSRNFEAENILEKDFGIRIIISTDYYKAKQAKDFIWLRKETAEMSMGLMVYTFPYSDTGLLEAATILETRNEITRAHIPGPSAGSYMVVSNKIIKPISRKVKFNGHYAIETRALWETYGDFMGGPFINYTVIDTSRQRVVAFDGYVYYPNKEKRNYIRQLEGIIWGAQFVSPSEIKK